MYKLIEINWERKIDRQRREKKRGKNRLILIHFDWDIFKLICLGGPPFSYSVFISLCVCVCVFMWVINIKASS